MTKALQTNLVRVLVITEPVFVQYTPVLLDHQWSSQPALLLQKSLKLDVIGDVAVRRHC